MRKRIDPRLKVQSFGIDLKDVEAFPHACRRYIPGMREIRGTISGEWNGAAVRIRKDRTKRKPGFTAKARAKKRRAGLAQAKRVALTLEDRDGACRLFVFAFQQGWRRCGGVAETAHLGAHRRYKTRGQPPEVRHDRRYVARLCSVHHRQYDAHRFDLDFVDETVGADGQLLVVLPDGEIVGAV